MVAVLLMLPACWAVPLSSEPTTSGWNHMDYAAISCDKDKPPSACPPLHPNKVASNTGPGGTAVIPGNNADTRSDNDFNHVETQASQNDVHNSAAQNNLGFSAIENNHGDNGFNGLQNSRSH